MAYTVLARKYRSRTFDEVIGQGPIATTLSNAIKTGRIHHGYLFTGTRGSGKTSMARILAKSLNCLKSDAPTVKPCLECDACRAIGEGQDLDVVEIDAASNTGVDNIRELRSNAAFRPARSRFKIYIIDEVHMLSTGAFNALLKTLEEPPEHVKFILATTEIQKVPATIQSRCQRFNFRNIGADDIAARLVAIAKDEKVAVDDVVTRRLARLANGSMRDALSLFDQLISVSPKKVDAKLLEEILPPAQDELVFGLISQAARGEAAAVLAALEAVLSGGRGLETLCNDAIETVRTLMLLRTCGADTPLADVPQGVRDEYLALSQAFVLSQYVQIISMLEELRRNVRFSMAGRALADATFVRIARMKEWTPIEQLVSRLAGAAESDEKKKPQPPVAARAVETSDSVIAARTALAPPADRVDTPSLVSTSQSNIRQAATVAGRGAVQLATSAGRPGARPGPAPRSSAADGFSQAVKPGLIPTLESPQIESLDESPPPPEFEESDGAEHLDGDAEGASSPRGEPSAASGTRSPAANMRLPAGADDRRRIQADPLVQQALVLFDGTIINMERIAPAAAATAIDAAGPTDNDSE